MQITEIARDIPLLTYMGPRPRGPESESGVQGQREHPIKDLKPLLLHIPEMQGMRKLQEPSSSSIETIHI